MLAVGEIARHEGFEANGFRVVINNGARTNQTVLHLHVPRLQPAAGVRRARSR